MNTEQAPRNMSGRGEACFGNTPCKGAVGENRQECGRECHVWRTADGTVCWTIYILHSGSKVRSVVGKTSSRQTFEGLKQPPLELTSSISLVSISFQLCRFELSASSTPPFIVLQAHPSLPCPLEFHSAHHTIPVWSCPCGYVQSHCQDPQGPPNSSVA